MNSLLVKRQSVRFEPESTEVGWLVLPEGHKFAALVFSDSMKGCGLIVRGKEVIGNIEAGSEAKVILHEDIELEGRICWVQKIDTHIYKLGIEFRD